MKEIIQINLKNISSPDKEQLEGSIKDVFESIIEKIQEFKLWDESIEAIIITNDFENEVNEQLRSWNSDDYLSNEKEDFVISKTIFNNNYEKPKNIASFLTFTTWLTKLYLFQEWLSTN